MLYLAFAATALVGLSTLAHADTLRVPADFPTIQSAIDAALPGDEIQVSKGTYTENVVIDGKSELTVVGRGVVLIDPNGSGVGLIVRASQNVAVSKLRFANTGLDGLLIDASTDVNVEKSRFSGIGRDGVRAEASARVLIEKNRIEGTGGDCISLAAGASVVPTDDSTIQRNKLTDCGFDGVRVDGSRNLVRLNRVTRSGNDGFRLDGTGGGSGNRFERNTTRFPGNDGISVGFGADGNTFFANKALNVAEDGLDIAASFNVFERNKMIRVGDDGVEALGNDNRFVSNVAAICGDDGVDLRGGSGNSFERNRVLRAVNSGFKIVSGGNTFISNSAARSGKFDLSDLAFPGINTYESNRFKTEEFPLVP